MTDTSKARCEEVAGWLLNHAADSEMIALEEGRPELAREAADLITALQERVAEVEETAHYANGVAELAMKHRDIAEADLAEAMDVVRALSHCWTEAIDNKVVILVGVDENGEDTWAPSPVSDDTLDRARALDAKHGGGNGPTT